MTTRLTFPASMFSVVCQRCGSTVRKNADSCPTCGADRSAAFGAKRNARSAAAQPRVRGNMFEQTASRPMASASAGMSAANDSAADERNGWSAGWDPKLASERIAQKAAEHRAKRVERVAQNARDAYAERRADPDVAPGSESWNHRKTVIAGACALLLLAGAVLYLQHDESPADDDTSASVEHSVSGAIDSRYAALDASKPAGAAAQHSTTPSQVKPLAANDPLEAVHAAIEQHDLTAARARLKALGAQQQARPEYDALKDELVKRELQRDAALQLARACERTSAWACVQQNAGEALALDGSNGESQGMLERVIEHAGWIGTNPAEAKKALASPDVTNATKSADISPAQAQAQAQTQANVAAAQPARTTPAQKAAIDKHAAQRSAAAQKAADQARAEADAERAANFARAQAATNALTAAIMNPTPLAPSAAPSVSPSATPSAQTQTSVAPRVQTSPPAQANQAAPATQPAQRSPQYLGDTTPNTHSPLYQSPQIAQPAAPRAPQYLDSTPPQSQSTAPAAPHQPQYMSPSSAQPVPHPPSASRENAPVIAQRVPSVIVQAPAAQAATQRTVPAAVPPAPAMTAATPANVVTLAPTTSATNATNAASAPARPDADKSDALERAIKQYGWSGADSMPKPAQ